MGFRLPEKYKEKQKEIHNLKYISVGEKEVHVSELEDRSVTSELLKEMKMNSYAQDDLPPKLTNEALLNKTKYYLTHCRQPSLPCTTYDEAIIHKLVPELIKRLEDYEEQVIGG
ncbi:hypothetical protein [Bacillus infantis]|uniref:hypothetical protein n=1 Tax=Bacillus infantis TaxID=324767 RepID=UPI00209F5EE3|nr:hypothetical protein [Bacillus infantis]MCP1159319.1 hypothetical protein [Bacillus infantis]